MAKGCARILRAAALAWLAVLLLSPAGASAGCVEAARAAEKTYRIPTGLLGAMAVVESRIGGSPNPFALNISGRSLYPANLQGALGAIQQAVDGGQTDVAVGCMQIRYDFHQQHFRSTREMLEPETNVRYAAIFLRQLHDRLGSWERAVSFYNAGQDALNLPYLCRVAAELDQRLGPQILQAVWRQCGRAAQDGDRVRHPAQPLVMVAAAQTWDGLSVIEPRVPGNRFRPLPEAPAPRAPAADEAMHVIAPVDAEDIAAMLSPNPAGRLLTPRSALSQRALSLPAEKRLGGGTPQRLRLAARPEGPVREARLTPPPAPAPAVLSQVEAGEPEAPHFAHLASYGDLHSATAGWQVLASRFAGQLHDFAPIVQEAKVAEDRIAYRLVVGAFANRADAQAFCQRLADPRQYCQPLR